MSSQSEAVLKHLTSEADEEVSEANMQHQVCKLHSEDNYKTVSGMTLLTITNQNCVVDL